MKSKTHSRFSDPWWISLPPVEKLILDYVAANCDMAGIFAVNHLDMEFTLGLALLPERWVNTDNPGVEYSTKMLAAEDSERLGLSDEKIRRRPIADWAGILERVNRPPQGTLGKVIPQIIPIAEGKWWYPRHIENKFARMAPDRTGSDVLKIRLDEGQTPFRKTIKTLRAEGLIERIKEFYSPHIEIIEAPSADELQRRLALSEKGVDEFTPTIEAVLSAKEGGPLTQEARRVFFFTDQADNWKRSRVSGWRNALIKWGDNSALRETYVSISGNQWPGHDELILAMEWIEDQIMAQNQNRVQGQAGLVLTPEAAERIRLLQSIQILMEEERA